MRDGQAHLFWETASQKGAAFFEVERSRDGLFFQKKGKIAARSQPGSYRFLDENASKNSAAGSPIFYRIKEIADDGRASFSKTIALETELSGICFWPNPVGGQLFIDEKMGRGDGFAVGIFNENGQLVRSVFSKKGEAVFVADLPVGSYFLKINGLSIGRFLKI